jgi:hypothetical protein
MQSGTDDAEFAFKGGGESNDPPGAAHRPD